MTGLKNQNVSLSIFLLISIVLGTCSLADRYVVNSILSLPLLLGIGLSTIVTSLGIKITKKLKLNQNIREEGPKKHQQKSGTPTMGGLVIVPIGLIVGNVIQKEINHQLILLSVLISVMMLIGIIDDWKSLKEKRNAGLKPREKLLLQATAGLLFLMCSSSQGWIHSNLAIIQGININVGILIWPISIFVLLAETNATNLTDGLDGLASGCGALVFTGLALELVLRGSPSDSSMASFSIALAGSWLGFLIHNRKPAKIFMGDTGSLPMGAALAGIALLSNSLWTLLLMGGVFLAESLSVILQVSIFKATKKIYGTGYRVLNMAPLHHHYELAGISEVDIVHSFWLATFGLVLLGLLLRPTI